MYRNFTWYSSSGIRQIHRASAGIAYRWPTWSMGDLFLEPTQIPKCTGIQTVGHPILWTWLESYLKSTETNNCLWLLWTSEKHSEATKVQLQLPLESPDEPSSSIQNLQILKSADIMDPPVLNIPAALSNLSCSQKMQQDECQAIPSFLVCCLTMREMFLMRVCSSSPHASWNGTVQERLYHSMIISHKCIVVLYSHLQVLSIFPSLIFKVLNNVENVHKLQHWNLIIVS